MTPLAVAYCLLHVDVAVHCGGAEFVVVIELVEEVAGGETALYSKISQRFDPSSCFIDHLINVSGRTYDNRHQYRRLECIPLNNTPQERI